jgi:hypothetical protein
VEIAGAHEVPPGCSERLEKPALGVRVQAFHDTYERSTPPSAQPSQADTRFVGRPNRGQSRSCGVCYPASDDGFAPTIDDNDGKKTVRVGDRIEITLKAKPAEDSKADFGWADPEVTGDAIRFVNSTNTQTPDRGDGGHIESVYEFRANDSGRSTLVIPLEGASEGVLVTKFSYQFLVVWPD